MSLDVTLTVQVPVERDKSGIFVREHGRIVEISRYEWDERNPGHEPAVVEQIMETQEVYSGNITHNLGKMAKAAGIYKELWRPEEIGITKAIQLVQPLHAGLLRMRDDPKYFQKFDSPNGWGTYKHFVPFVAKYLLACQEYPDADVSACR